MFFWGLNTFSVVQIAAEIVIICLKKKQGCGRKKMKIMTTNKPF